MDIGEEERPGFPFKPKLASNAEGGDAVKITKGQGFLSDALLLMLLLCVI